MSTLRMAALFTVLAGSSFATAQSDPKKAEDKVQQFVLFDTTFTFTKEDADNSKPSKSHYYVRGKMLNADGFVNEESVLNPVSLYAELKVKFERHLLERTWQAPFCPTSLRFSTVYGLSPRMRFDLTVNEFIRDATLGRDLRVFGEQFWRPYCHVEDLARSVVMSLEADRAKVDRQVFNVGATNENYQKKMIVDELLKVVPSCQVNYVAVNEDPRDYRVDFTKIGRELGFSITKRVIDGLREINRALGQGVIADGDAPRYRNI